MTDLYPHGGQPQESHPFDWQPCPLCDGKGSTVRFAGGGGTVAVRQDCGYCQGSGVVRIEPTTTDAHHD